VIVWIERGYTLQAKLKGTMAMKGKTDEQEWSGEGPMSVDLSASVR